jgi:hypothetical protein
VGTLAKSCKDYYLQRFHAVKRSLVFSGPTGERISLTRMTRKSCYTEIVSSIRRLRNVTVTLEEDVAHWARIEAARRDTSVSRLLATLLKERMMVNGSSAAEAVERLSGFGKRHGLSLRGLKIKDLINQGRR